MTDHTSGASLLSRWTEAVAADPQAPFLIWEDPDGHVYTYSYGEFDQIVDSTVDVLRQNGAREGSRAQLSLANSPQFVAIWLAAVKIGAVIVPTDPRGTSAEFARQLAVVRPELVVTSSDNAARVAEALGSSGQRPSTIVLDERDSALPRRAPRAATSTDPVPNGDTPAAVLFTSGTTSAPKGAVVTQANFARAGDVMAAAAAMRPSDRMLVVLPLFHANAQYYSFAAAICSGASVALTSAFSATRFLEQAARLEATCASLFAAPIKMILARARRPEQPLRLRHVWYAQGIPHEQYEEFAGLVGCRPRQLYGMTETIVAPITNRALHPRHDCLGEPTLGAAVALRDPLSGGPVTVGGVGEIVVKGVPGRDIFLGYLADDGVASPLRDGWFHTGDLARTDADGLYWFVGRRGDMLKVSGENVSTVEVEDVISSHPGVLETAVVGAPDEIRDEVPVAFVVLRDPSVTIDEIAQWCEARLAPSKRPREIMITDTLPRTSVGKIRKFALKTGAKAAP